MYLNVRAFALSSGLVAALLFLLCAAAVTVAPDATTVFAGDLTHADLSGIARTLTLGSFFRGLVVWTAATTTTFALLAWTYNRLSGGSRGA